MVRTFVAHIQQLKFNRLPEDSTNLHRHARQNAQEAISLARERALQFDAQAALERKTNEALKLAKAQAHIHEAPVPSTSAPLVDCMHLN